MRRWSLLVLAGLALVCPARADLVVTLERTGTGVDLPLLTLVVDGPEQVAAVRLDTADPNVQFDYFQEQSRAGAFTLVSVLPDGVNGSAWSQVLTLTFTDFGSADRISGRVDLDRQVGPDTVDWQTVLFNNGSLPNATLQVDWLTGLTTMLTFHDEPGRAPRDPYVLRAVAPAVLPPPPPPGAPVPEPSTLVLGALGSAIALARRLRGR